MEWKVEQWFPLSVAFMVLGSVKILSCKFVRAYTFLAL